MPPANAATAEAPTRSILAAQFYAGPLRGAVDDREKTSGRCRKSTPAIRLAGEWDENGREQMTPSYRWVIVAAGALMTCVAIGAMFSLAIFLQPMSVETGWSRTGISSAMTLDFLVMGAAGFGWGAASDRIGPRLLHIRRPIDGCVPSSGHRACLRCRCSGEGLHFPPQDRLTAGALSSGRRPQADGAPRRAGILQRPHRQGHGSCYRPARPRAAASG